MAKYIKKTDEIQAVQWNGIDSLIELDLMFESDWVFTVDRKTLKIHTTSDSGPLFAEQSDYIVVDSSTVYVVPQEIFRKKYERVSESAWSSFSSKSVNPWKSNPYTISGIAVDNAKFECTDCLDVSKDTLTFAQKTACPLCFQKMEE